MRVPTVSAVRLLRASNLAMISKRFMALRKLFLRVRTRQTSAMPRSTSANGWIAVCRAVNVIMRTRVAPCASTARRTSPARSVRM